MEIEIQAQGFAVTGALSAYLAKRLKAALGPFKRHVRRVVARLGDENGPRGGYDKTCRIGVSVGGAPDVFAADTRANLYAAIDCAVDRLAAALSRRLNRRRDLRRLGHARAIAASNGPRSRELRTLVRIISSTPRVFLSGCSKARFAGNSGAIAKDSNAAAAAQEQPNVEIILTRVLSSSEFDAEA